LQPGYSQYHLVFSWDPLQYERGPDNTEPGVIQLEIYEGIVALSTALTEERCEAIITGVEPHYYLIRILGIYEMALYLDGGTQPACMIYDIGIEAPIVGRITFRDMGLVSYVTVASP
jgi:hypothetical protein